MQHNSKQAAVVPSVQVPNKPNNHHHQTTAAGTEQFLCNAQKNWRHGRNGNRILQEIIIHIEKKNAPDKFL